MLQTSLIYPVHLCLYSLSNLKFNLFELLNSLHFQNINIVSSGSPILFSHRSQKLIDFLMRHFQEFNMKFFVHCATKKLPLAVYKPGVIL